jgi:hypothetical protein
LEKIAGWRKIASWRKIAGWEGGMPPLEAPAARMVFFFLQT